MTRDCCCCFEITFEDKEGLCLEFGEVFFIDHDYDPYLGPYEVTPLAFQEQVLPTKDKNMTDDVTVFEIPYDEVTNIHGTTVVIAS